MHTSISACANDSLFKGSLHPKMNVMQIHHRFWLQGHPNCTEEWLKQRIAEGFCIHHIDHDHNNNDVSNLALIYGTDHTRLHKYMRSLGTQHPNVSGESNVLRCI